LLTSHQIFRYAVPARTVTKKALLTAVNYIDISFMFRTLLVSANSVYLLKYDNWRMRHLWFWTVSDIVGFMQSFDLFTIQTDCVGSLGKSLPTGDSSTINLGDYVKIFEIECRRSVQSARSRCIQPKNWNAWTKSVNNDIFIWRFIAWNCCLLLDWGQV